MSSIPGQSMAVSTTQQLNPQLLFIGLSSITASFLVSVMWGNFVTSSVEAVQVKTNRRIPDSVSNLIAAICVTAVCATVMMLLYSWEKKALGDSVDEEGAANGA